MFLIPGSQQPLWFPPVCFPLQTHKLRLPSSTVQRFHLWYQKLKTTHEPQHHVWCILQWFLHAKHNLLHEHLLPILSFDPELILHDSFFPMFWIFIMDACFWTSLNPFPRSHLGFSNSHLSCNIFLKRSLRPNGFCAKFFHTFCLDNKALYFQDPSTYIIQFSAPTSRIISAMRYQNQPFLSSIM